MNAELVAFYRGEGSTTTSGAFASILSTKRQLSNILAWDDIAFESVHDYVQWLYPLKEASDYNRTAPILDEETIEAFKTDPQIRANVNRVTLRMAQFLCIPAEEVSGVVVFKKAIAEPHWIDQYNHNYKRLTRMLASLRLMGFEDTAKSLHESLYDLYLKYGTDIGRDTFAFWEKAATAPIAELNFK
jgi:Opioid growth factor receptor (OGFr) conserved region